MAKKRKIMKSAAVEGGKRKNAPKKENPAHL